MKKSSLTAMLCALAFIGTSQIDVTVAPLGLLWGDLSIGGDLVLSDNISAELGIGLGGNSGGDATLGDDYKFNNLNFQGTGKYYFNPSNGGDKFYAGVFLRYINRNYEYGETSILSDYQQTRMGGGFLFGHKIASNGGFIFDFNLGFGRAFMDNTEFTDPDGETSTIDWPDLMIVGKLGIGYRFGG